MAGEQLGPPDTPNSFQLRNLQCASANATATAAGLGSYQKCWMRLSESIGKHGGSPSHLHLLVLPDAIRCGSLISDEWGGILIGMRSCPGPLWWEGKVLPEWWQWQQPALAYS